MIPISYREHAIAYHFVRRVAESRRDKKGAREAKRGAILPIVVADLARPPDFLVSLA
jgi:hypothetical protein